MIYLHWGRYYNLLSCIDNLGQVICLKSYKYGGGQGLKSILALKHIPCEEV